MEWYEAEVRELERRRFRDGLPRNPVLFYGSSTIRMWDTLSRDLEIDRALNWGFGGSTLEACVWFFERLVPPLRPASLVVYAGDNDLGDGCRAREVVHRFDALLDEVRRSLGAIPFGFISIKPSPARVDLLDAIDAANHGIRRRLARHRDAYYVDVFAPMLTPARRPRRELFLADGLHLGRAGYELWARVLKQHRHEMFPRR